MMPTRRVRCHRKDGLRSPRPKTSERETVGLDPGGGERTWASEPEAAEWRGHLDVTSPRERIPTRPTGDEEAAPAATAPRRDTGVGGAWVLTSAEQVPVGRPAPRNRGSCLYVDFASSAPVTEQQKVTLSATYDPPTLLLPLR